MAAKFKADSQRWLTLDYSPLELEQEVREFWEECKKTVMKNHRQYNTFGEMQTVTDMEFGYPEDEGCSRK